MANEYKIQSDALFYNGKIYTGNAKQPQASAIYVKDGKIVAVGSDAEVQKHKTNATTVVDLRGRRVIPGLNDSHLHIIRAALNYHLELRWDGVTSLKLALQMLKEQAARTPKGQWVRVVGGWSRYQFEEKRLPTLEEVNEATGDVPCFILHLYSLAYLNRAGIKALNYDKNTTYAGGEVQLDQNGNPTGLLIAKPSAMILYSTLGLCPKLQPDEQISSTLHYYRELNRLGLTSAIDPGGGGQAFPIHYEVSKQLAQRGQLTLRTAYYLFAQVKGKEVQDFGDWVKIIAPGHNDDPYNPHGFCMCGAGENIVWSAADFENFLEPRPELSKEMEGELKAAITIFAKNRWPFRIHATYNESITRFLNVFEEVNRQYPFNGLKFFIDHAETITDENLKRLAALGGGIAVQNRMMFQGEYFMDRYGKDAARHSPPMRKMLNMGIPVGFGTDGTRVSSYGPWPSIYWAVTGKTWGGIPMYGPDNLLTREEAIDLYTRGSAWFSAEDTDKGTLEVGKFGDFAVLTDDVFAVPEETIKHIESVLTVVGGRIVWGAQEFAALNPPLPAVQPDWSPVAKFGGYWNPPKH